MKYKLFYFFIFFVCHIQSQDKTFYHYGLEDGLSQQTIRCILKDSRGFLWLGTQDGLNRFDSNTFRVFRKKESDSLTISGKFINDIVENNDGTIWIATANNGVCFYNPDTDVFTRTDFSAGNCTSLSKNTNGTVYATSLNKGLYFFSKENGSYKTHIIESVNNNMALFSASIIIDNTLYLGTAEGQIFKTELPHTSHLKFKKLNIDNSLGIINKLHFYNDNILLGTSNGLFQLNINTNVVSNLNLKQYNNQLTENLVVESIASKSKTLYVGTDNGLFILDEYDNSNQIFNKTKSYKGDRDNINSITSNRVYDILLDDDLLWIGTNNLDVASLNPPVFKTINTFSSPAINNNYVFSILKTERYLFIGTRDGLNCIDRDGNVHLLTRENTKQKLAYNVIRGMAIDNKNNLWLATTKGISILNLNNFDPNNPNITSIFSNEKMTSLSDNKTRGVYLDHNNVIWITTYGGGINRFTGDIEQQIYTFERYIFSIENNSISSNFTFNISQDAAKNYWITSDDGLNKLTFKGENYGQPIFSIYKNNKADSTSLKSNTALHTHHDKEGILWVATQNGLHKFNKTKESFTNYNESNGLSNTYVYSILEDNENKLWVSTNDGLFRFDKELERFTNFSLKDGVQSTEFNLGAHFKDSTKNELYFGGINGFNVFNPERIGQLDSKGQLLFTELLIKDTLVNPVTNPKILEKSITESKTILLNYDDFPCTIKFSDLNFRPQNNTQFVYRLNNANWNTVPTGREIQLLDLPTGQHTVAIQGLSRNIMWDSEPLKLAIQVFPPWYKSNLVYFTYLLIFLLTIYQFYRLRLRQQLAKQETKRLQELDNLKSRFITNITHEFRTPLTIIMGYVDTLKSILTNHPQANVSLKSIERNSHSLITLVNQMLDLAKLEQGQLNLNITQQDLISFSHYLVNSFTSLAESKNVKLLFNANVEFLTMDFDQEKWRQILTNLLSNAIKFTKDESIVEVNIVKLKTNELSITITDEGIGIPEVDLPFVFDRFYQATNNIDKKISGTGIGLALTKELVELMKGSIVVNSIEKSGTTFSIKLPITTTSALQEESVALERVKSNALDLEKLPELSEITDANTILIVEDNEEIAHYIGTCLHNTYHLEFAANGEEGLALAETKIPDIIITDLMMPKMDGYTMTEELQNNSVTNHIPIIMLTAKAMQNDKVSGLRSGADAYLTKPFQKEELLVRIETLIAKRKKLQEKYVTKKLISFDKTTIKTDKNLEFLERVVKHIQTNLENPDYNAAKLSSDLCMSESQLYRKLKAVTNKSSAIFIRSVRLEKAKDLIESTTLSISEIAYLTGFSNPNWFGKAFKEEFGKNPSECRS